MLSPQHRLPRLFLPQRHILSVFRNLQWSNSAGRSGDPDAWLDAHINGQFTARNPQGHVLGLVGLGNIGYRIAAKAHAALDKAVDAAYIAAEKAAGRKPPRLGTDAERVAFLFERYQALTSLLPAERPKKARRSGKGG